MTHPGTAGAAQLVLTAQSLAIDRVTAEVVVALREAGIASVLMKGPVIARWLYPDGALRPYNDSDLLVAPDDWETAKSVVRERGFVDSLGPLGHPRMESYASHGWERGRDQVDLHCTLWGIHAPMEMVWDEMSFMAETIHVGGITVPAPREAAMAMHVALHAAQHGPGPEARKAHEDLERAVARVAFDRWVEAVDMARRLDAVEAFAAGLRMRPTGRALCHRLRLGGVGTGAAALRSERVPLAEGLSALAHTRGAMPKLRLAAQEAFPTPAFMAWWTPLARRGRLGLLAAYAWRPMWLMARTPRALWALRPHRESTAMGVGTAPRG